MPRIFDNIDASFLPALQQTMELSGRADFCVGYFNLRGWKQIDHFVEKWSGGDGHQCRLLVGMQRLPQDELREALSFTEHPDNLDNQTALRLNKKLAEEFRQQFAFGIPTNDDEAGLRRLAAQLRAGKVVVKLFLKHTLHAKLYLHFRPDPINPIIGYLGSSNLTFSGLSYQGELNVDVLDHDAGQKLADWFKDRWKEKWCVDITKELIEVIEQSWAREGAVPPHPRGRDTALPLRDRRPLERLIVGPMRGPGLRFDFAHGVDLPPPRAIVYFIRAISAQLLLEVICRFDWFRHFWADSTYGGLSILAKLREWFPRRGLRVEIVRAKEGVKGFAVQPKRWIIERTFAWLTHNRRLVRDYEEREVNSEAMILIAAMKLMVKRLAKRHY